MLHFSQVAEALERRRWIYAKTMPQCPHWYCLRKEWRIELPFEQVVQYIRDVGYWEKYGRNRYVRLNVNGYKYWSMGAPLPATILINRAKIERPAPYDEIAPVYDTLWSGLEAEAEDAALFGSLSLGGSVLDIGCGTGLLLGHAAPDRYFGVDPSQGMLDRFKAHLGEAVQVCSPLEEPDARLRIQCGAFEALWTPERFDHAVALYGAASYIDPATWGRLPGLLAPGGRYALMFYREGYRPVTHLKTGVELPIHHVTSCPLSGTRRDFGNFTILEGPA